ncbi:MAG TPA: DsbA family protein [Anaerolineae bacterium]|nr:DsbA family protein [Anaerolineae bacterium]
MSNQSKRPDDADPSPETPIKELGLRIPQKHLFSGLLAVSAFIVGLAGGYLIWGRGATSPEGETVAQTSPQPAEGPNEPQAPIPLQVSVDDDPAFGPVDAPITIIEFADFNCGYCRRFYQQTLRPLLDAYPNQIRFVFRDLPVVGGFEAAQAAECADEQGAFWEFHDLLFTSGLGEGRSSYIQYAEQLELDSEALSECLDQGRYAAEVEADAQYAINLGATGVPLFFINGIPIVGAQPLPNFMQVIDQELGR